MEVKLVTKLTSYLPKTRRQTRTMVLHRSVSSQGAVDDIVHDMKTKGWVEQSVPATPSPTILRCCSSCGVVKPRKGFSRYQCRSTSPRCLGCTTGEVIAVVVAKQRRLVKENDESKRTFVPPPPRPEKPDFVPPRPNWRRFMVRHEENVRNAPSFKSHVTGYVHPGQVVTEFGRAGAWINISSKACSPLWIVTEHVTTGKLKVDPAPSVAAGSGGTTCAWDYTEVRAFVDAFSELFRPR
jgi:hypothetical protein